MPRASRWSATDIRWRHVRLQLGPVPGASRWKMLTDVRWSKMQSSPMVMGRRKTAWTKPGPLGNTGQSEAMSMPRKFTLVAKKPFMVANATGLAGVLVKYPSIYPSVAKRNSPVSSRHQTSGVGQGFGESLGNIMQLEKPEPPLIRAPTGVLAGSNRSPDIAASCRKQKALTPRQPRP